VIVLTAWIVPKCGRPEMIRQTICYGLLVASSNSIKLSLTTVDPTICQVGGKGLLLPLFSSEQELSTGVRSVLYLFGLLWCFVGVAIVADTFMAAIETITSQQKVVMYKGREFHVKVRNNKSVHFCVCLSLYVLMLIGIRCGMIQLQI
jgi:hypothetical protein